MNDQLRLLALDPATYLTGYAFFMAVKNKGVALVQHGLMRAEKRTHAFDLRCLEINSKIRNFIVTQKCNACVLEFPQFQAGPRGNNAARQGDTLKLSFLCGSIATGWQLHIAMTMAAAKAKAEAESGILMEEILARLPLVTLITPSQWKGSVPKKVTAHRCEHIYKVRGSSEKEYNFTDAIMIGDFWLKDNSFNIAKSFSKREDF